MKTPRELSLIWLKVGAFAFEDGNVAPGTIRQEFVERRTWIEEGEFARTWALCQASPGINLLCLAILMGRRLGGRAGAIVSLLGMALPGAILALALAAGFVGVSGTLAVGHAMRAVVPAMAGLGFASVVRAGLPLLRKAGRDEESCASRRRCFPSSGSSGWSPGCRRSDCCWAAGAGLWWTLQ